MLTAGLPPGWQEEATAAAETAAREEVLGQSEHRLQTLKLSSGTLKSRGEREGLIYNKLTWDQGSLSGLQGTEAG